MIEFRRYTCKESGRAEFAHYFESYFPEAFEQLGSLILGSFLERDSATGTPGTRGPKDGAGVSRRQLPRPQRLRAR